MGSGSALRLVLLAARAGRSASSQFSSLVGDTFSALPGGPSACSRSLCTLLRGSATPASQPSCSGRLRLWDSCGLRLIHSSAATAASDYYELLGLSKGASDQDIKKAYYQLAKKYHPDTNKDDPAAAARFQELQKAYEVLRDPEKRRMYDQIGREGMDRMESGGQSGGPEPGFEQGFPGGFNFGGVPFMNEIFEQFLRADPRLHAMLNRVQLPPIRISFMEAVKGTRKSVDFGLRQGSMRKIELDIPPGVDTGDMVETAVDMPGPGRRASARMVLNIPIEVQPHPTFRRDGCDIASTLQVPLTDALLGTTARVETLDGHVELIVPPLTQQGDRLRIRNKGIFNPRRGIRGDHYVDISIVMPRALSPRQRELLLEFQHEEDRKKRAAGCGK
ncbi:hypothetical protein PLESTB_001180300 [Pleodorina starrii]|uniref:J domain-containing protein n=1 Tax=Pleodorina starrii TaxID=330485 RepID=A0A9W6F610_9CHLO|nr:hypothetical protein PLESTM_000256200 [Pleodorina starrii]GLC57075.1 hypothetical protein PLESTB_001180300 [Pleodorina starrii]GLC64909.1 hypothetical protein PLESTF_000220700 [Pleodorina starrii]